MHPPQSVCGTLFLASSSLFLGVLVNLSASPRRPFNVHGAAVCCHFCKKLKEAVF